ncbi:MAG: hypothetical protein GY696_20720 [Gammaproteobacteria bacterium]|nr:hypothetical protein [Gammaproteobacteria bacterium]
MSEYLASTRKLYLPRKLRFSDRFVDDLTTLTANLTSEVVSRCVKDMRQAQNINGSLAFFLRDALSLMDRTYVLNLIRTYCKQMAAKIASLLDAANSLMLLKLEFLRWAFLSGVARRGGGAGGRHPSGTPPQNPLG